MGTGFSNDQTTDIQAFINAANPYSSIRLTGEFSYTALSIGVEGLTLIVDGVLKQFDTTTKSNAGRIVITSDYVNIEGGQFDGNTTPAVIVKIEGADYCTIRNAIFKNMNVDNSLTASSGDFGAVVVNGNYARIENCTFNDLTNTQDPPNRINDSWPRGITILSDDCVTNSLSFFRVQGPHVITGDRFQSFDAYIENIEDNGFYLLGQGAIINNPVIIDCHDEPFVFGAPSDDCRVLGGYVKNHKNAISFDRATNIVIDGLNVDSTASAGLFKLRGTNTTHGQTITAITQASQAVVTANGHGLGAGAEVTITGATPTDYNGTYTVASKTTNTLTLNLNSSSFGAYTASSATLTSEGQGCRNIKIRNLTAKVASLFEVFEFNSGTIRDFLLENSNIQYAYSKNDRSVRVKNITQAAQAEVETPQINKITTGMTVTIANATPSGYNGTYTVQSVVNSKKFTINLNSTGLGAYVEADNYDATVTANLPYAAGADATDFSDGSILKSSDMQDFIIRSNTFNITDGNAANEVTQYKFSPVSTDSNSLKVFSNNQIITESATGDTRMNVEYADFDSPFMFVQPSTGVIRDYKNTLPMFWSSAAPSAGTFKEGTIIFNSDTDEGGNVGWVYVSGAWKPFSRIGDTGTVTADNFRTNSTNDGFNLLARDSSQTAVYIQQAGTGDILDLQTGSMDANAGVSRFLVDGSGNVSFYNSAGTSSDFYWDSSASSLGLGVTNPTSTLDIVAPTNYGLKVRDGTYTGVMVPSALGGIAAGTTSNHPFILLANNTERMRVTSTGIDVTGNISATGITNSAAGFELGNSYFYEGAADRVNLRIGTGGPFLEFVDVGSNVAEIGNASGELVLTSASTGRVRIDNSGDVSFYNSAATSQDFYWDASTSRLGLGTIAPSYTVSARNDSAISYPLSLESGTLGAVGNTVGMLFGFAGNTYQKGAVIYESLDSNARGKMHFALDDSLGSGNVQLSDAKMTIDYAGNVGIGVSPTNKLDVYHAGFVAAQIASNSTSESQLRFATNTAARISNQANTALIFDTNATERMRIRNDGILGIGVTNPEIFGKVAIQGGKAGTANSNLSLLTDGAAQGELANLSLYGTFEGTADNGPRRTADIVAGFESGNWGTEYLAFHVGNGGASNDGRLLTTERARIDGSGNLLVGALSATNTVTVDGGIDAAGASFFGGSLDVRINSSAINSIIEGNSDSMAVRSNGSTNINYELGGSTVVYTMNLSTFSAVDDDARSLGQNGTRWSVVYAATGTISTSDERLKQQVRDINEAEARVAVAAKGLLKAYKYNDAVETKGDGARWHIGIIAQELKAAFEAEGLDAHEYGMFCWDEWWEAEVWNEDDSLENGGYYQRETFDLEADAPEGAVRHDRYSIRYEELLAFIIASI